VGLRQPARPPSVYHNHEYGKIVYTRRRRSLPLALLEEGRSKGRRFSVALLIAAARWGCSGTDSGIGTVGEGSKVAGAVDCLTTARRSEGAWSPKLLCSELPITPEYWTVLVADVESLPPPTDRPM